jgi:hypothetical protein
MARLTVLTQSSMRALLQCGELWRLKVLALLRKPDWSPPLVTGSAFHHGIQHRNPGAGARHYLDARGADMLSGRDLLDAQLGAAEVFAMVEAALAWWGDDWPERQEVEFDLPFRNPATGARSLRHVFRGVLDGFPGEPGTDPRWVDVIGEWKTASKIDDAYIDRLTIDWQVSAYCEAASLATGRKIREVRYRIVRKPGIRPSRGESEAQYRQRCEKRADLPPLKRRTRKTEPKDAPHDFDLMPDGTWEETLDSWRARMDARESKREPLKRKVPDTGRTYLARLRRWYAEDEDEKLVEVRVTRTEQQMTRWRYEAWELHLRALAVERAHEAALEGRIVPGIPIRNDSRCTLYGVRCDFLSLCSGLVGPEAYRVIDNPHPELSGAADVKEAT